MQLMWGKLSHMQQSTQYLKVESICGEYCRLHVLLLFYTIGSYLSGPLSGTLRYFSVVLTPEVFNTTILRPVMSTDSTNSPLVLKSNSCLKHGRKTKIAAGL